MGSVRTSRATDRPEPSKTPKPTPSYTTSQEPAIGSAKDYLSFSAFSRVGLIQQLHSEYGDGYTLAHAPYAANHVGL